LKGLVSMAQMVIEESRRIMTDLRPSLLDDLGIVSTIGWFCREFQKTYSNIHIDQMADLQEHEIPESLKIVIFRVIQEAFHNVAKYSKAELVALCLAKKGCDIELTIKDNGVGFEVNSTLSKNKGLGLNSMKERTELSGGSFTIESIKGVGTVVKALWSVEK